MKVVCLQFDIKEGKQEENFFKIEKKLSQAAEQGAELVCLPELFSTGVTKESKLFAEEIDGKTSQFLSDQAKAKNLFIVGSFIENNPPTLPRNILAIYNPNGELIGKYYKNHVFTFGEEHKHYSQREGLSILKIGKFTVCPLICYDLRFPELFRTVLDQGVNLFIIVANWPNPRKEHWLTLLKARAIENQAYVIGVNCTGNNASLSFFGNSQIISPQGEVISTAGENEEVIFGDLFSEEVDNWRRLFPAIKDRREKYYDSLRDAFKRADWSYLR